MFKHIALSSLLLLSLGGATAALAEEHHSHAAHGDASKLELNQGQKWETDAPLRKSMLGIREEIAARLPAIHEDTLPRESYQALGEEITQHVEHMILNCELPPAADAQLHILIGRFMQAAETLQKSDAPRSGAIMAVQALATYGEYFDHPGWQDLAH